MAARWGGAATGAPRPAGSRRIRGRNLLSVDAGLPVLDLKESRREPKEAVNGAMKATTLRFSEALWDHLSEAAALAGVSVAQYVRDAALIRLTHEAARRGVNDYDDALLAMTSDNPASSAGACGGEPELSRDH